MIAIGFAPCLSPPGASNAATGTTGIGPCCNTGSQPCGLTLVRGFVKGFREAPPRRLGDAWRYAISYYHERERLAALEPNADWYPPSIFFQGMKFMLFGDPALLLPDAGPEREL